MSQQLGDDLVTVHLYGLPLPLHEQAQQQSDAMRREFQLIVEQAKEHEGSVPARLLELSTLLSDRYDGFNDDQEQQVETAIEAGEEQLDELVFLIPAHAGEAAAQLGAVLGEADEFCRQGQLLTLAPSREIVAYRNWFLDNFVAQCAGGPPQPWTGPLR